MKLPSVVRQAADQLHPQSLRQHPMSQDPISVVTLGLAATVNILTILLMVVRLRRVDYPVPVHYLSLVGIDQLGSWWLNFRLGLFAMVVTIINGLLAAKSYQRNRLVSFFLLVGAAVVAILSLVISAGFAAIV
jgi:hypothetical protein